jgi:hypothetical protein
MDSFINSLFPFTETMPQYETGYPPLLPGYYKAAYDLGCALLDAQDRLLAFDRNKRVRRMLQLGVPKQATQLFWLSLRLNHVIEGSMGLGECPAAVLKDVKAWIDRLETLAVLIGA